MKTVLVTGGIGFIGSHTVCELINSGNSVVIIDNFSNSDINTITEIEKIVKNELVVYEFDINDKVRLDNVFKTHKIDAVIHFAAYKSVFESIKYPLKYYTNNVVSTITLLEVMNENNCKEMIFSSSATVYGNSISPLKEDSQTGIGITNPYGQTKYMMENILEDYSKAIKDSSITILRYFNPIGAHPSGLIGENPKDIPNNIMPIMLKVAIQNNTDIFINNVFNTINIFGNNYNTPDGTCIRDYIHVVDLARAHVMALNPIKQKKSYNIYNIGTGKGYSVLELINKFKEVNNVSLPYKFTDRRDGDIEEVYCNSDKAYNELGWKAELSLDDMCKDSMNFIKKHSNKI